MVVQVGNPLHALLILSRENATHSFPNCGGSSASRCHHHLCCMTKTVKNCNLATDVTWSKFKRVRKCEDLQEIEVGTLGLEVQGTNWLLGEIKHLPLNPALAPGGVGLVRCRAHLPENVENVGSQLCLRVKRGLCCSLKIPPSECPRISPCNLCGLQPRLVLKSRAPRILPSNPPLSLMSFFYPLPFAPWAFTPFVKDGKSSPDYCVFSQTQTKPGIPVQFSQKIAKDRILPYFI